MCLIYRAKHAEAMLGDGQRLLVQEGQELAATVGEHGPVEDDGADFGRLLVEFRGYRAEGADTSAGGRGDIVAYRRPRARPAG